MEYKYIITPKNCTGCGLCVNVCSKDAIRLVWSHEGFLVPEVDTNACINCGLCAKQCIALAEKPVYTDNIENVPAWGGWNKNKMFHLQSSSGGIFTAIAEHILAAGGCVFGVVWKDKYTAVFDKAECMEDIARMRGSKYTPAVPGKVYQHVKGELKSGRQVLFSGTPCQVHALKKYLRTPYDNLLTIDIVCHGMPSHLLLEKYVAEKEAQAGKAVHYISFRDKTEGWIHYHITCHYTDGSTSSTRQDKDIYMRIFLSDKALNYACYNCPYAHIPRQGDISLGDYWGVRNYHRNWPIDKGISAILANTSKGLGLLNKLHAQLDLRKEPFQSILRGQSVVYIRPQKQIPSIRVNVLQKLKILNLSQILQHYTNTVQYGPFILPVDGYIPQTLRFIQRVFRFIKRKVMRD